MYPRQSPTTHTEQLSEEASVYDWARAQVHALNPTAAFVWRRCDGATSPAAIAAAVQRELNLPEAEAVVDLALAQLARLHLLEQPVASGAEGPVTTRRWLLGRGVAAAMVPAIASIVAPSPVEAQSPGPGVPTLTSVEPKQGAQGTTITVRLNGTNFVVGATAVEVSADVAVEKIVVDSSTSLSASFVLDSSVAPGPRTVRVRTGGGTSDTVTFTITRPGAPTPTLTTVAPNQGVRGSTVAVTLTGTNFVVGGTTVAVAGGGVTVTSVVVTSATSLTANFVLDATAAAGARAVTVTTADGTSDTLPFTITASASSPMLTSVAPNLGLQGTTVAVTLTGTNYVAGATTVAVAGAGVTVNSVVVGSATSLTANFVVAPAAAEGPRMVTVTTAAGTSGAQTFTVTVPLPPGTPTLTAVAPNQGVRGSTVVVTLTGSNFVLGGTTVTVGGGGATVTNIVVSSETSLTASFVLDPAAAEGPRTVTVTTAIGTSAPRVFTITLPPLGAPTLTSVTPDEGIRGTTVAVTLTGTNFVVGATTVAVAGGGVTVNNVVVGSSTSLMANFALDPAAADGPRSVTITTAAGTSGAQTFTIEPPPAAGTPTLTSVSPNQGLVGTTVAATLTGTNFAVGATTVTVAGGGVIVNNVVVGSNTSLTANFVLDTAAGAGPRAVRVETVGGRSAPQGFTITLPPPSPPTLTGVSPNQGIRGESIAVTLTGTNFVAGATTVAVAGGGVTVTNVTVGSATSLTASFVLDGTTPAGARPVTVTTAGGTSGAQSFLVREPLPGSQTFSFTGGPQTFTVPAGVSSIVIEAYGAAGGAGSPFGERGSGGRTVATVAVVPGTVLTVRCGGPGAAGQPGSTAVGGFNGGGPSTGDGGGGGGGATSVRDGNIPLVIAGGGGGSGSKASGGGGNGGDGGGLEGRDGEINPVGGFWGSGGTQLIGGAGGAAGGSVTATAGTRGIAGTGGTGGSDQPGVLGGGGGGGGYFGGGGGGGGTPGSGGGGGGSSFIVPGATNVINQQGTSATGFVIISW